MACDFVSSGSILGCPAFNDKGALSWYGDFVGTKHNMVWISIMPSLGYLERAQKWDFEGLEYSNLEVKMVYKDLFFFVVPGS